MDTDWYGYLRLEPGATDEQIAGAVERLSRQATALATTAPERSQQLRETVRSIKRDLMSGPESRERYDQGRAQQPAPPSAQPPSAQPAAPGWPGAAAQPAAPAQPGGPAPAEGVGSRIARFMRTGWACPNCGKGSLPNEKFCAKCGSPIQAPAPRTSARGPAARNPVCANCGKQLRTSDVFCGSCGTRRTGTP
jgi:hypothetical protein